MDFSSSSSSVFSVFSVPLCFKDFFALLKAKPRNVKGDTNGTNTDCAALLNRAGVINLAHPGGALRLSPRRSALG